MENISFQLSIDSELELFRPEIEYAVNFLTKSHFLVCRKTSEKILHYCKNPPANYTLQIPNYLTQHLEIDKKSGIYLNRKSFYKRSNRRSYC